MFFINCLDYVFLNYQFQTKNNHKINKTLSKVKMFYELLQTKNKKKEW